MKTSSHHVELQIVLSCCLGEYQRFKGLSSVIEISEIVSDWLVVYYHLSVAFNHKDLGFACFSSGVSVKFIWKFFGFFDFLEFGLSLFERKEFELKFRIDHLIRKIILIHFLSVFSENREVVKIRMSVQIKRHFVKT